MRQRDAEAIAKAPKGTTPRNDEAAYQLVCAPRTVACPPASPRGAFLD